MRKYRFVFTFFGVLLALFAWIPCKAYPAQSSSPLIQATASGAVNFFVAATGSTIYERTTETYFHSDAGLFFPFRFIGLGGFYHSNDRSRQKDRMYGPRIETKFGALYFAGGVGLLNTYFQDAAILRGFTNKKQW